MAEARYDQANFTGGEIDPRTQARGEWEGYFKSAKLVRNCLCIPQGGVTRRWGSTFVAEMPVSLSPTSVTLTNYTQYLEISTLICDDNALYLLSWTDLLLQIYLENVFSAVVVTTFLKEDIADLNFGQVENRLIVVHPNFIPKQLVRSGNVANIITGVDTVNNRINITNALTVGMILATTFTTAGTLPVTTPQIFANRTYFLNVITANSVRVYASSEDAVANVNFFTISAVGAGVSNVVTFNFWTLTDIPIKFYPAYDFTGGYFAAAFTFTPSATTGAVTLVASGAIFTTAHIGGLYRGNGGVMRITAFTSNVQVTGYTVEDFASTAAIRGDLSFLGEPAWSATRGFPRTVSFFQNRLVFAGSPSIPNGVWLSVINDVFNFDDSQSLDDDAISWYPAAGVVSFIRAITSGRSLIIHANTGNFSTPIAQEFPVTPRNFVLSEQNKFGVSSIQPVFIDNQVFFVDRSGTNVISMMWEITQSSYVTDNRSVASSNLIDQPLDMEAFSQPEFTDGFYVLFVNADGTMAVLQTLVEQNIAAWSLMSTSDDVVQPGIPSPAYYRRVASGLNRCWVIVQRFLPVQQTPTAITAFSGVNNTLTSIAHGLSLNAANLASFTTTGTLPTTTPQIVTTQYYWMRGITVDTFKVYTTFVDASLDTNAYVISSAGINSNLVHSPFGYRFYIEELDFTVFTDSSKKYTNLGSANLTGLAHLNGVWVQIFADGYVLPSQQVFSGGLTLPVSVTDVYVGPRYQSKLVPLPVTVPGMQGMLYRPKHIRNLYIQYFESLGVTVQGTDIPVIYMQDFVVGVPSVPETGVFEYTPMEGWDGFSFNIEIVQEAPLPMTILALSYVLEV